MRRSFLSLITFTALALALAPRAMAQSTVGTVTGTIRERGTERVLAGVQVRVVGTQRAAPHRRDGHLPDRRRPCRDGPAVRPADRLRAPGAQRHRRRHGHDGGLRPRAGRHHPRPGRRHGNGPERAATRERRLHLDDRQSGQITTAAISTFSDALSSRAPGVVVQTSAGESGAGTRMRIRGSNSISLSNEPLLIVDGVRLDNTPESSPIDVGGQFPSRINDINPEDIESIEVIKGPAAAALYGTAAANGVHPGHDEEGTRRQDALGRLRRDGQAHGHQRLSGEPALVRPLRVRACCARTAACSRARSGSCVAVDSTISNIPIKSSGILQDGNRRLLGASVTGGAEAVTYFISSEYQKEQNVVPSNGLQRMNIRTNLRVAARPLARRAAQHRLREQRPASSAERQQLVRRRLGVDARQRGELRARPGAVPRRACAAAARTR